MDALTGGSLFTGIGGLDLGLERAGIRITWQCEQLPYARAVLTRHWPGIPCYPDVRGLVAITALYGRRSGRARRLAGSRRPRQTEYPLPDAVDVLFGGFPCQPTSNAGRRQGRNDSRWLWPEFARMVGLLRPRYVFVENPPGLLRREFGDVLGDLAERGYDAEWESVPAAAVGAPHQRDRVWLIAYPNGSRQLQPPRGFADERIGTRDLRSPLADANGGHGNGRGFFDEVGREWFSSSIAKARFAGRTQWGIEPNVGRVAHGIPSRVDRLNGLGNAVVPQVAEVFGRAIVKHAERWEMTAVLTARTGS